MFLKRIRLTNLLSFVDATIELAPLNVFIGANASGKSNVIEAIGLLQGAPNDFASAVLRGGGVRFWLWLGGAVASPVGGIECVIDDEAGPGIDYWLKFSEDAAGLIVVDEGLKDDSGGIHFSRQFKRLTTAGGNGEIDRGASVLALLKNPLDQTPITRVGRMFDQIKIYRELHTDAQSGTRNGVASSVPNRFLDEAGNNLAVVLQDLYFRGVDEKIQSYLRRLSDRFEGVKVRLDGQIARTYLQETGLLERLPSVRMSDGTLRFLCLLAVLLNPDPPPLVCIEEPEVGLHPDAIRILAEVLVEASERMQLVVTTHSEVLVDALSDTPEVVVVVERGFDDSSSCRRLSAPDLAEWLKSYSLGQLWRKGEIGGTRW